MKSESAPAWGASADSDDEVETDSTGGRDRPVQRDRDSGSVTHAQPQWISRKLRFACTWP